MIDGCASLSSHLSSRFCVPPRFSYLSSVLSASLSLRFSLFPSVFLFCCFCFFWRLSGLFQPRLSFSPSLLPSLLLFVDLCCRHPNVALAETLAFTHKAQHTDTRNILHTHTHTRTQTQTPRTPCRSFPLPHSPTPYTHACTPTRTHTPTSQTPTHEPTNARTQSAHTHSWARVRLHVLACVSQSALCVSNPACTSECGVVVVSVGVS